MMMAAVNTFGAADSRRRAAGIPRMFREAGFDRKTTPVAYTVVFLCRALDHSVSRIECHQSHVIFFSHLRVSRLVIRSLLIFMLR
jgi:hypothetical protein